MTETAAPVSYSQGEVCLPVVIGMVGLPAMKQICGSPALWSWGTASSLNDCVKEKLLPDYPFQILCLLRLIPRIPQSGMPYDRAECLEPFWVY